MSERIPLVAVIGKGTDCPFWVEGLAYEVGLALARVRLGVLTGGLGGVMRAAAEGAYTRGLVVSLVPLGGESDAHPHADVILRTGLHHSFRNVMMAHAADAAIMLPGSHGTVSEATNLIDLGRPVIALGDHDGWLTSGTVAALPDEHRRSDPRAAAEHVRRLLAPVT